MSTATKIYHKSPFVDFSPFLCLSGDMYKSVPAACLDLLVPFEMKASPKSAIKIDSSSSLINMLLIDEHVKKILSLISVKISLDN